MRTWSGRSGIVTVDVGSSPIGRAASSFASAVTNSRSPNIASTIGAWSLTMLLLMVTPAAEE